MWETKKVKKKKNWNEIFIIKYILVLVDYMDFWDFYIFFFNIKAEVLKN